MLNLFPHAVSAFLPGSGVVVISGLHRLSFSDSSAPVVGLKRE